MISSVPVCADERTSEDRQEYVRFVLLGSAVLAGLHICDVPDGGPAIGNLQRILAGSASEEQRAAFAEAWHRRVQVVLDDDSLFTVETV